MDPWLSPAECLSAAHWAAAGGHLGVIAWFDFGGEARAERKRRKKAKKKAKKARKKAKEGKYDPGTDHLAVSKGGGEEIPGHDLASKGETTLPPQFFFHNVRPTYLHAAAVGGGANQNDFVYCPLR